MKAWFNEKGNWCFEFDDKNEKEIQRLILTVSEGVRYWRRHRKKYPAAFISSALLNACFGTIFVGQNYSQEHPTVKDPMEITSKTVAEHSVSSAEANLGKLGLKKGWNTEGFNKSEIAIIKKHLKEGKLSEML